MRGAPSPAVVLSSTDRGAASPLRIFLAVFPSAPVQHAAAELIEFGRVREPGDDWSDTLEQAAVDPAHASFRVDRLCVVASQFSPRGSIYTVRHEARLADSNG